MLSGVVALIVVLAAALAALIPLRQGAGRRPAVATPDGTGIGQIWPVVQGLGLLLLILCYGPLAEIPPGTDPLLRRQLIDLQARITLVCLGAQLQAYASKSIATWWAFGMAACSFAIQPPFGVQLICGAVLSCALWLRHGWVQSERARTLQWQGIASTLGLLHTPGSRNLLEGSVGPLYLTMQVIAQPEGPIPTCLRINGPHVGSWSAWCDDLKLTDTVAFVRAALDAVASCRFPAAWPHGSGAYLTPNDTTNGPQRDVRSGLDIAIQKVVFLSRAPAAFEAYWTHDAPGDSIVVAVAFQNSRESHRDVVPLANYQLSDQGGAPALSAARRLGEALAAHFGVAFCLATSDSAEEHHSHGSA